MFKKSTILLCISLCASGSAWAMDVPYAQSMIRPDKFPFAEIVSAHEPLESKLKKLQMIANFLVFQAECYKSLKNILVLLPELHKLQPYRVIDQEGKVFLSAFHLKEEGEVSQRYTTIKNNEGKTLHKLNVCVPEAEALSLQVSHFLKDWKLKYATQVHQLDRFLCHENENVRAITGMVKHYAYSCQLAHCIFAAPHVITSANHFFINETFEEFYVNVLKHDRALYQTIMQLPRMHDLTHSLAQLVEFYRASGSKDDFFEMYIDAPCLEEMKRAQQICVDFESYIPQVQSLYDKIRAAMSRLILQEKDRAYQHQLKEFYYMRDEHLFNINPPRALDVASDLALHYVSDPQLPQVLDFKVIMPKVCAKAVGDNKNSFVPNHSKSVPAARKQSPKKKKIVSQPQSRSQSPTPFLEEETGLSAQKSLVSPVAVASPISGKIMIPKCTIQYDQRVLRWDDPNSEDPEVIYASRESKEYHAFSKLVDKYLFKYGVQTPWQNKGNRKIIDKNYSLGGTIQTDALGKRTVVFTICFDQKNICYHRGLDKKEKNELYQEYFENNSWKVFHRDEFPKLGDEKRLCQESASVVVKGDEVVSEDDLCVKIRDNNLPADIVLYKPAKQ